MEKQQIVRKGAHPLYKYTVRVWGFHTIMIDDDYGDIFIASDRGAFMHWWSYDGRGKCKLREFLLRTSDSYLSDKFSYGLSRWDSTEAATELYKLCEQKWGHIDEWPIEVVEAVENRDAMTRDEMYHCMFNIEEFREAFDPADLPGESSANPEVKLFMKNVWPAFKEFLIKELEAEKTQERAV